MSRLVSIHGLTIQDVTDILDLTERYQNVRGSKALAGKTVVNMFFEDSTRTRISFELAAKRLGADVVNFTTYGSSLSKGEGLIDTVLTLDSMHVDAYVVRHPQNETPLLISKWVTGAVINAGDGTNEHPTQALLDLYTIREKLGAIAGLKIGIVGDIRHSRVAHSLKLALAKMGAVSVLIGPRELVSSRPGPGVSLDFEKELPTLDVCYMLRYQGERYQTEYSPKYEYRLTPERRDMLPEHAIIMHPGPINRGVEIDSDVADGPGSVILDQVRNGVAVRAAVLRLLLMKEK